MSEILERAAQAMHAREVAQNVIPFSTWESLDYGVHINYLANARATIEALRRPTQKMCIEGHKRVNVSDCEPLDFRHGWTAAIDSILTEAETPSMLVRQQGRNRGGSVLFGRNYVQQSPTVTTKKPEDKG